MAGHARELTDRARADDAGMADPAPLALLAGRRLEIDGGGRRLWACFGGIARFTATQPSNTTHLHQCWEVCLLLAGRGLARYGERDERLADGDLTVAEPGEPHELRIDGRQPFTVAWFTCGVLGSGPPGDDAAARTIAAFAARHRRTVRGQWHLRALLDGLAVALAARPHPGPFLDRVLEAFVLEALAALAGAAPDAAAARGIDTALDRAVRFLHAHPRRRPALGEIARAAGVAPRTLQALFRRHLGTSPTEFANARRMHAAAAELLRGASVADAAAAAGVADAAVFSRLFRRHYRMAPRQFRAREAPRGMLTGARFVSAAGHPRTGRRDA